MSEQPSTPDTSSMSAAELSAEVLRARAELAATVDELSTRLSPKNLAADAATTAETITGFVAATKQSDTAHSDRKVP